MPLGKLSKKQIERAYRVLSEALDLMGKLDKKPNVDGEEAAASSQATLNAQLLDCSNRFYTLIPHDFGMKTPPLLKDLELIKVLSPTFVCWMFIFHYLYVCHTFTFLCFLSFFAKPPMASAPQTSFILILNLLFSSLFFLYV